MGYFARFAAPEISFHSNGTLYCDWIRHYVDIFSTRIGIMNRLGCRLAGALNRQETEEKEDEGDLSS